MLNPNIAYRWSPIEDLPNDLIDRKHPDLLHLAKIWSENAQRLLNAEAVRRFNDRLRREWAIETGIIEGLYSLDRGITQLLIEKGIEDSLIPYGTTDRPVSEIVPILKDQEDTLEGLFDFVSNKRKLTVSYVKELHQSLTRNQKTTNAVDTLGQTMTVPLLRGAWKTQSNNPFRKDGAIHEYCPPEQVASEMDRLIDMHETQGQLNVSPEISAAWLHHRFTQIHPFQDGNGRVARALASLVFIKAGWFPLVISRDTRDEYIEALERADKNDLEPLVELMSRIQKSAFFRAVSISEDTLRQTEPIEDVIARASDKIRQRKYAEYQGMLDDALKLSLHLESLAEKRLKDIEHKLKQLREADSEFFCKVTRSDPETDHWFKHEIVEIAKKLEYFADTRVHRAWIRLKIHEERDTVIVVSFHGLGTQFLGLMAVSAFLEYKDRSEDGSVNVEGPHPICRDLFQFSYMDKKEDKQKEIDHRFDKWLSDVMLFGLDMWQRQL